MSKKRDDDIKDLVSSVNKIKKWKNRLIFSVIGIAVVGVIIVFLVILIGSETDEIVTAYNNLSGKPYDSKQQFGARNVKITKDNNGKLQIELILGNNKNDSDLNGTSDSDPGTPDGDTDSGNSGGNNGGSGSGNTGTNPSAPTIGDITDQDILDDIAKGLYTKEDYEYLVALGGESSSYDGFYAVACCLRNRVQRNGSSYKAEVTRPGQFAGYHTSEVGKPRNEDVKKAAIAVLRGGASTIGNSYFFFGRINGWDLWADSGISEFYNIQGNIFYNYEDYGKLHNKSNKRTINDILIYDAAGKWIYGNGSHYKKG